MAYTEKQFQAACAENIKQFHTRLKNEVKKLTCDLTPEPQISLTATREELFTLIRVYHGELKQVVDTINNAKVPS